MILDILNQVAVFNVNLLNLALMVAEVLTHVDCAYKKNVKIVLHLTARVQIAL